MNEAWMPVAAALVTGLLSLLGVYLANRKSAALIEFKIEELRDQVARHNSWGDRITTMETQMKTVIRDVEELKRRVNR